MHAACNAYGHGVLSEMEHQMGKYNNLFGSLPILSCNVDMALILTGHAARFRKTTEQEEWSGPRLMTIIN